MNLGVEDGQTMSVTIGASEVYVTFRVKPSDLFRREKSNIHSDVNISVAQAILGGTVRVPGIYEDHVLKVCYIKSFSCESFVSSRYHPKLHLIKYFDLLAKV